MHQSPFTVTPTEEPTPPTAPAPAPARSTHPGGRLNFAALLGVACVAGIMGGAADHALTGWGGVARAAVPITTSARTTQPASFSGAAVDMVSAIDSASPAVVSVHTESGLGSGVIYDASGLVLTNQHVIDGATRIMVSLADGRHFTAKVLGSDKGFDLAVLKIEGANLPVARFGSSGDLVVGQPVAAIGNPYGFDHSVTTGVVSANNRPVSEGQGSYNQPMIQTDAAINPGNSGGPLIDARGNVIGITTLIAAPQGYPAQGLGFAVPIDTAQRIIPQLVSNGKVSNSGQPYLGISLSDVTAGNASVQRNRNGGRTQQTPTGVDHGALAAQVDPAGPGGRSGLQNGDVITRFDSRDIYTTDELLQALVLHRPNDRVEVTVVRNGQPLNLTVTIGEAPAQ